MNEKVKQEVLTLIKKYELRDCSIEDFAARINWPAISYREKLSEDFIEHFSDYVIWPSISFYQKLSEGFIKKMKKYVDWYSILSSQKYSDEFLEDFFIPRILPDYNYSGNFLWEAISMKNNFSYKFLRKNKDRFDWKFISMCRKMSLMTVRKYVDKIDFKSLLNNPRLIGPLKMRVKMLNMELASDVRVGITFEDYERNSPKFREYCINNLLK